MNDKKKIKLKIATPERVVFQEEVERITIPTKKGEITILPDHISLISNLSAGAIELEREDEVFSMAISGGFLDFHKNELTILADTAERAEEIDIERAEEARKKAEEMKQDARKSLDEEQYAVVVSRIEKQLARIRTARRFQRRGRASMNIDGR